MLWHKNPRCLHSLSSQRAPLAWERTLRQTGEGHRWKMGGGGPVVGKPIGSAMILFDLGRKWHSGNCSQQKPKPLRCGLPLRGPDLAHNSMDMMCSGKKGLVKFLSQNMVRIGEVISSRDWLQVMHCEVKPLLAALFVFNNYITICKLTKWYWLNNDVW